MDDARTLLRFRDEVPLENGLQCRPPKFCRAGQDSRVDDIPGRINGCFDGNRALNAFFDCGPWIFDTGSMHDGRPAKVDIYASAFLPLPGRSFKFLLNWFGFRADRVQIESQSGDSD